MLRSPALTSFPFTSRGTAPGTAHLRHRFWRTALGLIVAASATSCSEEDHTQLRSPPEQAPARHQLPQWTQAIAAPAQALMAVHGTNSDDVWVVGADAGQGPLVQHFDGGTWSAIPTPSSGDLWWVQALRTDSVYAAGASGTILHYDGERFERMTTPSLGKHTVFGIWAASDQDIYAVGAEQGRNGFVWHYDGERWQALSLPEGLPLDQNNDSPSFFKVWGRTPQEVWIVGDRGTVLRGNAVAGFEPVPSGTEEMLFTVHGREDQTTVVGGSASGMLLDASLLEENSSLPTLQSDIPDGSGILQGVWLSDRGRDWAVGVGGVTYLRDPNADPAFSADSGAEWQRIPSPVAVQSLHAVWVDPDGGAWAVGGNVLTTSLDEGVALYSGQGMSVTTVPGPVVASSTDCPEHDQDPAADRSIARRWNEQLLAAIRRDLPSPTVHARNLWHTSLALWDAWAGYDEQAVGYVSTDKLSTQSPQEDRRVALSYAAYRVLTQRYAQAVQSEVSLACFAQLMDRLGLDRDLTGTSGDTPAAWGNRVGQAILDQFAEDGSNETNQYADPEAFAPPPPRLVVDLPGTRTETPTVWQQLDITEAVTQNGIAEGSGVRTYVGAHWGQVTPFALTRPSPTVNYFTGANPPDELNEALVQGAMTVLVKSSELALSDGEQWDISPAARGNNTLGQDDNLGHALNPSTGLPYAPQPVPRGDFTRVLAEFWADGPESETPPGHWNTLANTVSEESTFPRALFGDGRPLDELAWDVHLYLALNGAVHDAAIAAWQLKRHHLSARPITLIRYLAGKGQRSNPDGPSYDPEGIELVEGMTEVITEQSSAPGQRHEHLARYVGEIALHSWRGEPGDPTAEIGGVGWIRAIDWRPYQRSFFVTPAFPGYVSGHSTFSRAAAVVLHQLTGDEFFPGGLGTYEVEPGYLFFEYGPSQPITLQWATYYDAADQAGQSRLWGGIHIPADDFDGRRIGQQVGEQAVLRARSFYADSSTAE